MAFPLPGLLQSLGDLGGHIILVVLGQDLVRPEHAVGPEAPLSHDSLSFPEEVGQDAHIGDRGRRRAVGQLELDLGRAGDPSRSSRLTLPGPEAVSSTVTSE